jgi:hypothetical protein
MHQLAGKLAERSNEAGRGVRIEAGAFVLY